MGTTDRFSAEAQPSAKSMARAARHTVLRRIAPALKHDMVVHLQAVALMAEMLSARVDRGASADDLQASVAKLSRLAREAVASCLQVTSWIAAPDDDSVPLRQGVQECVALLNSSFNFRGFTLHQQVTGDGFEVNRSALRHLLVASLLMVADAAAGPCELLIEAQVQDNHALLRLHSEPREHASEPSFPAASDAGSRPVIDWAEVQALAAAEGVELSRGTDTMHIRLPRAVVTSPLQMAPV